MSSLDSADSNLLIWLAVGWISCNKWTGIWSHL